MADQVNRSVLVDHEIIVDGVVLRERKELTVVIEDGKEKKILNHIRSIGDKTYVVKQITVDGKAFDESVETTLSDEECDQFREEWEANWHPTIGNAEASSGGIGQVFRRFLN